MIGSDEGIELEYIDGEWLCTVLVYVYGIPPGLDVGTKLGSLDGSFDSSNNGKHDGLLFGGSLVSIDGKVTCSDESIKLGSTHGTVLWIIL